MPKWMCKQRHWWRGGLLVMFVEFRRYTFNSWRVFTGKYKLCIMLESENGRQISHFLRWSMLFCFWKWILGYSRMYFFHPSLWTRKFIIPFLSSSLLIVLTYGLCSLFLFLFNLVCVWVYFNEKVRKIY